MKERGDSEEAQIAKMREIQNAIKAQEDYLKSINGSQIDINKLEEEWWSYQNRILESTEQTANANEKNAQAIQAAVDAQIALNNALKERNVHVFNSETGQWEWQANPTAVSSARNALISAAQNLPDGIRENFMREYGINLPSSSTVSNVGGTSNYGNTYNFGNFTLTEEQAKSMSVYELARLSAALGAYNNSP
jgi:flagellar biosynthesis/type III secretory pathway chaperone